MKEKKWAEFAYDPTQPNEQELDAIKVREKATSELLSDIGAMRALMDQPGWKKLEAWADAHIETLRNAFERGDDQEVRARIYALRWVLKTVKNVASYE